MMLYPPIDELVKKTDGNMYILCNLIIKRAKEIETVRHSELAGSDKKAISIACEEVYQEKVKPSVI